VLQPTETRARSDPGNGRTRGMSGPPRRARGDSLSTKSTLPHPVMNANLSAIAQPGVHCKVIRPDDRAFVKVRQPAAAPGGYGQ